MISPGSCGLLGVLGGGLALDRAALLQTMMSRPLVASTLAGGLLGNLGLGLLCGTLLELLWLMELPVGASLPPDESLTSLLASAFAVSAPLAWPSGAQATFGVLLALPFGYGGRFLEERVRRGNAALLASARERVASGRPVTPTHLLGGVRFFLAGGTAAGAGAFLGSWAAGKIAGGLPSFVVEALSWTSAALPVIGIAAVMAAFPAPRQRAFFGAAFVGGVLFARLGCLDAWRGRCRP